MAQGDFPAARMLQEECLALAREIGEHWDTAWALLDLGLVDLAENKSEAGDHILQSLRLRQEMSEQLQQTSSLIGVAGLALHEGNPHLAAKMLGAVESILKGLNATVEGQILFFYTQTLTATRETLGESAFQSAWEEGEKWSLDEAVAYALEGKDEQE